LFTVTFRSHARNDPLPPALKRGKLANQHDENVLSQIVDVAVQPGNPLEPPLDQR
jgi:hypothetical protein